jgi:outer membrane protein TolC
MSHKRPGIIHNLGIYPALLFIIFILTGCAKVGPEFHRPEVSVLPNWMEEGDNRVNREPADYRYWWHTFNDPVLNSLIDRAYRENLTLRIAGVRVLEARAQLGIANGELYPQTQQAFGSLQYNRTSLGSSPSVSRQSASGNI